MNQEKLYNEGVENMKRKLKRLTPTILLIIVLGYFFLTPIGALRLAVAIYGYPVKSITLQISDKPYGKSVEDNQKMYTLINPPYEESTESELKNWIVTRYGIFYFGNYHGWA